MVKKMWFCLSMIIVGSLEAADYECKNEFNDDELLNETITKRLREAGIDANLCFCGSLDFSAMFINQTEKKDKDGAVASLQGDINLKYLQKYDGYGFGCEIGAKTRSGVVKSGQAVLDSSFLFMESDQIGSVKLGYTNTAADKFSICGDKVLVGYQGAGSGNLHCFYNASSGSIVGAGFVFDDDKAAKISWLSPIISGFSVGLSFTPDSRDANLFKTEHDEEIHDLCGKENFANSSAYSKNIITGGIAYEWGAPDGLNAKFSVGGWFGKGKPGCRNSGSIAVRNVHAYNVGALLGYKDFKVSLGYTDNGKSLLSTKYAGQETTAFDPHRAYVISDPDVGIKEDADSGKIYSIGAAYAFDKLIVSAGYFRSEVKFSGNEKAKADIITLATQYEFSKVLSLYLEYDNINTSTCDRAMAYAVACEQSVVGKNRANAVILGIKFNF
ncbi:MAG: porin [Holosporaceae bacterium]|nr:porin [Holosporaceae bacterium]